MDINLVILVVLVVLAVIDLTVGVANDAVNFLNAAVGSKAGRLRTVLIVAAIGVLVGVMFSGGMMKIARSGIFDPSFFLMPELLIIFAAAMFQDILLLDTYNTLGLPTSTTVSVVFGLFGGAFGMTLIKLATDAIPGATFLDYMNMADVTKIVIGIFMSVVVAFTVGFLIQFISRLIFTFKYKERFKKFGGVWGAIALSSISMFIVVKGLKNAETSFIPQDFVLYAKDNLGELALYLLVGWFLILQPLISYTKVNVLKMIVMAGTFSLAMAFAANDLVNFIGAPLAALNTYDLAMEYGPMAETTLMGDLEAKAQTNKIYIILAGVIMMVTLFVSKKARTVTDTTIGLSSQESGEERFKSNFIGRFIVKHTLGMVDSLHRMIPEDSRLRRTYESNFNLQDYKLLSGHEDKPAFDLIRAAVILMVSAALISLATTMRLPLSTTYVTFIVAMAAALPDRAWGRETAAYRVSGVINVVGGWFATALIAMAVSGLIAVSIYYGGIFAIGLFSVLTAGVLIYSTFRHKQEQKESKSQQKAVIERSSLVAINTSNPSQIVVSRFLNETNKILEEVIEAFGEYDEKLATKMLSKCKQLRYEYMTVVDENKKVLSTSELVNSYWDDDDESSAIDERHNDVNTAVGYHLAIISSCSRIHKELSSFAYQVKHHIKNSHSVLGEEEKKYLYELYKSISLYIKKASERLREEGRPDPKEFLGTRKQLNADIAQTRGDYLIEFHNTMENFRSYSLFLDSLSVLSDVVTETHALVKYVSRIKKKNVTL